MAKIGSFCSMMAILLLSLTLIMTKAARPEPVFADISTPVEFQYDDVEGESFRVEENCDELGEDECLTRRSLAAHTDYIYTQKNKP